jgi:hypothetical protein
MQDEGRKSKSYDEIAHSFLFSFLARAVEKIQTAIFLSRLFLVGILGSQWQDGNDAQSS